MKFLIIALALMTCLLIVGCAEPVDLEDEFDPVKPLGRMPSLNDMQTDYYRARALPEYHVLVTGTTENLTERTEVQEITLNSTTSGGVSVTYDDLSTVSTINDTVGALGSGNYTVNYQTGYITLDEYKEIEVLNETNLLFTNVSGGDNVTNNQFGIKSIVIFNTLDGDDVIASSNYTVSLATGNVLAIGNKSGLLNKNVSINYTYYWDSWTVNVSYIYENKITINCTKDDLSGDQDSMIRSINFITLSGTQEVGLWTGGYVVSSTGGENSSSNLLGDKTLYSSTVGKNTLELENPMFSSDNLFYLNIDDVLSEASPSASVQANVICKYFER